jgi:predicted CXXCH cytochrome family protein
MFNRSSKLTILSLIGLCFLGLKIVPAQDESQLPENDQCVICHKENEILPEDFHENDIHLKPGLSCAGCHGGNPTKEEMEEAMSEEAGFVGVPSKQQIPKFCGKCHSDINVMREYQPRIQTDQVEQYYTSVHGMKLKKGDQKVADCSSCHSAHSILSAKDSRSTVYALNVPITCKKCHADPIYMKEYGIPTDQFIKYSESVHGIMLLENQDTGAPACNDCHGNHGARPPGVSSVSHVCGNCHVNNMQYFSKTRMAREFEKLEIHGCEGCHGNHEVKKTSDDMVGTSEKAVCTNCHDKGDAGYTIAGKINDHLTRLVATYDSAQAKQNRVQRIGMDDAEINYLLQESHQSLIQARTLVHTFDPEKVGEKTTEGIKKAKEALDLSVTEIKDYNNRRRGFGIATLFITVLAIALFLKIRDMEKQ